MERTTKRRYGIVRLSRPCAYLRLANETVDPLEKSQYSFGKAPADDRHGDDRQTGAATAAPRRRASAEGWFTSLFTGVFALDRAAVSGELYELGFDGA